MEILKLILFVIELTLLMYFGLSAIYFLVFSVASHFYREKQSNNIHKKYRVSIIIPSYKEDGVIVETAHAAANHESKKAVVITLIVADSLKEETIDKITAAGVEVLPVSFRKSTKVKSINKALQHIPDYTDYVIILDADNIMHENFIDDILTKIEQGFRIVQGQRTAKNSNTQFARLDGISEAVNNSIFREGHRVLGLSASLIGSGFICEYSLFKNLMHEAEAVGGFDKELELMLLERKITIGYAKNAVVYDEKVQYAKDFVNQRTRWISAQFIYFGRNIGKGFTQLFKKGNIDYFDKLIQFLVPPRVLTLGVTFIIVFLHVFFTFLIGNTAVNSFSLIWLFLFIISCLAVVLAIPGNMYNRQLVKSLLGLPKGFLLTCFTLFRIKGANKKFIHTTHGIN